MYNVTGVWLHASNGNCYLYKFSWHYKTICSPVSLFCADEELWAICVWSTVGHRQCSCNAVAHNTWKHPWQCYLVKTATCRPAMYINASEVTTLWHYTNLFIINEPHLALRWVTFPRWTWVRWLHGSMRGYAEFSWTQIPFLLPAKGVTD